MTQHYCDKEWVDGPAAACDKHERLPRNSGGWRWGRGIRSKMDKEAGTVGTDRGGFISGTDSGR
jgi:hypothetical protein